MKCQCCDKEATVHLTQKESDGIHELHFCDSHARNHGTYQGVLREAVRPKAGQRCRRIVLLAEKLREGDG